MDGLYEMSDDQIGWCMGCGAGWFQLEPLDGEVSLDTALCVDPEGNVTGYSGRLVCIECGEEFVPGITLREGRRHLRVVEAVKVDG